MRGSNRGRTTRGFSAGATLGLLLGILLLPAALRLLAPRTAQPTPLIGHHGWINGVAYSPDGRYLATASDDHQAILWDVDTGRIVARLVGHSALVDPVLFSPDGRHVATASFDGTARLWTVPEGRCIAILAGEGGRLQELAFSQDGTRLAAVGQRCVAYLWSVPDGALLARATDVEYPAEGLAVAFRSSSREPLIALAPGGLGVTTANPLGKPIEPEPRLKFYEAATVAAAGDCVALGGDDGRVTVFTDARPRPRSSTQRACRPSQCEPMAG